MGWLAVVLDNALWSVTIFELIVFRPVGFEGRAVRPWAIARLRVYLVVQEPIARWELWTVWWAVSGVVWFSGGY